jgi:hypothetical protein
LSVTSEKSTGTRIDFIASNYTDRPPTPPQPKVNKVRVIVKAESRI